jgi:N-acyl-L-homoserine lactone synthetase
MESRLISDERTVRQGWGDARFRCELVSGRDVDRVVDIRRRVYVEEFGFDLGGAVRDSLDDRAWHLLATGPNGEPAGALRLVDDASRPFEVEKFLALSDHLDPSRRAAEITRLCILAPYRRLSSQPLVHIAMLKSVFYLARSLGATDLIASTRPDLAAFYRYLLFEMHPEAAYRHPEIGFAVHVLMRLDLCAAARRYEETRPALFKLVRRVL